MEPERRPRYPGPRMPRLQLPSLASSRSSLAACLLAPCLLAACASGSAPTLQPVSDQTVRVNEELRLTLGIDNPEGRAVAVRIEDPMLPSFDRVHSLSTEPGGALFRWAPLSSQAGRHELVFVLTDGGSGEYDRETVSIEVLPSEDAAPVFVRPGAGGTYDLEREPCVTFDVEVRDDDSTTVDIGNRGSLPERATLANSGAKRATFDWCPTPDQVASSERWTVQLFADDGDHPQVEHDYIIVLRSGPKDGCPGAAPVVSVTSPRAMEAITSGTTYPVEVTVTDDMGLRDPPLLYYSLTAPDDPTKPDVTAFEQVTFEPTEGDDYVARIPSLGLAEGEMEEVFFLVSATDNDDPSGSICDHRTDTTVTSFFAVGGTPPDGSLAECAYCTGSTECDSGICAATASGGRCVDSCSGGGACDMGTCGATVTTEGGTRAGCGPSREICGGGGGTCTDDSREPDDSTGTATPYSSRITDGQICAGDSDYFSFSVGRGERVIVSAEFATLDGDLDLELSDGAGTIVDTSAGVTDTERVEYCNADASTTLYARVFGYGGDENSYTLDAAVMPDSAGCCMDDRFEDDDTRMTARSVTFSGGSPDMAAFDGTVCSGDDDWIAIPMTGPGRIEADLVFVHADGDIDMALFDPSGVRLASGASVTDDEALGVDVSSAGTYALRVYVFGSGNTYLGEVRRSTGTGCSRTADCPVGTVCDGTCENDRCTSGADCPAMHACLSAGPIPAASHCGQSCASNSECRSGEACKWTLDGRGCAATGGGSNGASCTDFTGCGGQRTCLPWVGGYCARARCSSNADCETGTYCVAEGGINVCALSCVSTPCRESEGYSCDFRPTLGGTSRFVCLP